MAETKTWRRGYLAQLTTRLEEGADEFLKIWKTQAKRPDRVGDVTYRGLELVHRGLRVAVRSLSRIERATQLPHRTAKPQPAPAPKAPFKGRAHLVPMHHGKRLERPEPEPTRS